MARIYLDASCVNRPFDDQTQARIRLEAEAVLLILKRFWTKEWQWIGSEVLDCEIGQTSNLERRRRLRLLASVVAQSVLVGQGEIERGEQLETLGFGSLDALHLACAERARVNVFLTTDDRLLRLAVRFSERLRVRVENPLIWLREVVSR